MGGRYSAESRAQEVREYVQAKGWPRRVRSGWVQVRRCPICNGGQHGDEWTFALNSTTAAGVCHRGSCAWSGTLSSLKAQLGDLIAQPAPAPKAKAEPKADPGAWRTDHDALLADEVTLKRLEAERGITPETVREWRLGYRPGDRALVFPFVDDGGRLAYVKTKTKTRDGGKTVRREPGGTSRSYLFGGHRLRGSERVVVVEGEEDAMLLAQAGVPNVVSVPDGAKITGTERNRAWLDRLEAFEEIVVCLDADAPGAEGAEALARLMGAERCRIVEHPEVEGCKDATDYWRAGALEKLVRAIDQARGQPHPLVVSAGAPDLAEAIRKQHTDPNPHGLPTGWRTVDDLLGGMRPAELTILTAHTGAGKSAWAVNLLAQLAQAGVPVLGASFELSTEDYLWRFLQKLTGRYPWARSDSLAVPMSAEERDDALARLADMPLWIIRHFGTMRVEQYEDAVRYAARRLGVRVCVLDHIHFMTLGAGDDERHVLTDAMYRLKSLARELGLSLVVVAHPSRAARGKASPDLSDLHGAASLEQIADNVVTLQRVTESETPSTGRAVFSVKKLRAGRSGRLGSGELTFSRAGESFEDPFEREPGEDDLEFADGF